jgi:Gpi18-like mannosyltransferase
LGLVAAVAIRAILLPASGLRSDLDLFTAWIHWIATQPLGQAYRVDIAFPPFMVYVFWLIGIVQPAFQTATDSSDQAIRVALKIPPILADAGLAIGVAYLLRDRPRWALAAGLGVLLSPVVVYTSAWWGQFDSIYVLAGLVAAILAIAGRPYLAAVALGVALSSKPQALAFVPPFAAWAVARLGWRRAGLAGLVAGLTIVVLWVPFVADGGPTDYLRTLDRFQTGLFAILSLRAWNPWWILQTLLAGDDFASDGGAILGPLSPRILGYVIALLLEIVVFRAVMRAPTKRGLLLGVAASVLVCFCALTSVHERYGYAALIFLAPLIPDRRILATWLALTAVMTLNVVAAVPPTTEIGSAVPINGALGLAGSLAMIGLTAVVLWLLATEQTVPRAADGEYERTMATTDPARASSIRAANEPPPGRPGGSPTSMASGVAPARSKPPPGSSCWPLRWRAWPSSRSARG